MVLREESACQYGNLYGAGRKRFLTCLSRDCNSTWLSKGLGFGEIGRSRCFSVAGLSRATTFAVCVSMPGNSVASGDALSLDAGT